jgi:hypothetical protein
MLGRTWAVLAALTVAARAGKVLWTGSFDSYATGADFDKWSWGNQVGEYQWYIHGSQATTRYLSLDPSYKNPASSEKRGLKLSIDSSSVWNGGFERSELIPQTTANLGQGNLFYHFSMKRGAANPPVSTSEHQICFFESHFTELKYGVGSNKNNLVWMVSGVEKWSTPYVADQWLNFAYDIDFSAKTVGLWASTGSAALKKVVNNISASTSTNSADWHLGVLRINAGPEQEDYYFSGVYIEQGPITTSVGTGGGGTTSDPPTTTPPTTTPPTTTPPTTTPPTTTAPVPTQTQWGQCGGTGWTGPTACASGTTCQAVSPPYYYQCK